MRGLGGMSHATRMMALMDAINKKCGEAIVDRRELSTQFLNLSRCIDHTVASNQKPVSELQIFNNFKQFLQFKDDDVLRPVIMVLMLSIKSACLAGWFKQSDAEDLLTNFKVLFDYFILDGECCKPPDQSSIFDASTSNDIAFAESFITMICSRYYPGMILISVIVALTAKPGYETRGCDFQITSQLAQSTKLRLFVCQRDSVETSACLVTPPLLSFLLNGRGVERRMYLSAAVEAGPQTPSDITALLRIGCNFLQVIGQSTDTYFVAVALMGSTQWTSSSVQLQDYVFPLPSTVADDELTIGHSRVSLRCPISHKRIITPVKGMSCRHHQAFEYDSYMEINDRRPSWRCPCCNAYVNCLELRLDRQIQQILKEVDEKVIDVLIKEDGSWAPDVAQDETVDAHSQCIRPSSGDTVLGKLEGLPSGVIILSDDSDDEHGHESYRELGLAPVSSMGTRHPDVDDIKPNIRSMFNGEAVTSAEPLFMPAAANSDALASPVLNAIYSPISDIPDQAGPVSVINARSLQDSQGGLRTVVQNPARNISSWQTSNNPTHLSQPSDNRLPSVERQVYPQPSRWSTVIQALPAPPHFSNGVPRAGPMATPISSSPAGAMAGVSHAALLPTLVALEDQRQLQQALNGVPRAGSVAAMISSSPAGLTAGASYVDMLFPGLTAFLNSSPPEDQRQLQQASSGVPGAGSVAVTSSSSPAGAMAGVSHAALLPTLVALEDQRQLRQALNRVPGAASVAVTSSSSPAGAIAGVSHAPLMPTLVALEDQRQLQQTLNGAPRAGPMAMPISSSPAGAVAGVSHAPLLPTLVALENQRQSQQALNVVPGAGPMATPTSSSPAGATAGVSFAFEDQERQLQQTSTGLPRAGPMATQISSSPAGATAGVSYAPLLPTLVALEDQRQFQQTFNITSEQFARVLDYVSQAPEFYNLDAPRSRRQPQQAPVQQGMVQTGHNNMQDPQTQQYSMGRGGRRLVQGVQNSNQHGQQLLYSTSATQPSVMPGRHVDHRQRQHPAQHLEQAVLSSSGPRNPIPHVGDVLLNRRPYLSYTGAISASSSQVSAPRVGSHSSYPGGTNPITNTAVATIGSPAVDGRIPPPTNSGSAGTPRMRGAIGGRSATLLNPATRGRGGTQPGAVQPGPVNRTRTSPNVGNVVADTMSNAASNATPSHWGGHGSPAVARPSELHNVPGSLSSGTLLQDVTWPPTILETNHIENAEPNDTGFWMGDSPFMEASPHGH